MRGATPGDGAAAANGAAPGDGAADTVRVVACWRAPAGGEQRIRDILRELARATRREPGCRRFEVLEADGEPGRFVLLEEYAGAAGRARHLESEHFRRLVLDTAVPLLAHRHVDAYHLIGPATDEGNRT